MSSQRLTSQVKISMNSGYNTHKIPSIDNIAMNFFEAEHFCVEISSPNELMA